MSDRALAGWERDGKIPNAKQLGAVVAFLRDRHDIDLYTYDPSGKADPGLRDKIRADPVFSDEERRRLYEALDHLDNDG